MNLIDPMANYCKHLVGVVDSQKRKIVDTLYAFHLDRGLCKADAIWTAIEETQDIFDGVDLSVNFDGSMI